MAADTPRIDIDVERPSPARVYDYLLGGTDNYPVDREAAEEVMKVAPESGLMPRANREFLNRAVRYLHDAGIRQFLDIGSGLPTQGNVHELAPEARVVYVDNDSLAVSHAAALLEGSEGVAVLHADARDPESILAAPQVRKLIDFSEPVAVLAVSVLHFIGDIDPAHLTPRLVSGAVSGSALAICHLTSVGMPAELGARIDAVYGENYLIRRDREEIAAMFAGLPLVEPGLVDVQHWRGDPDAPLGALRMFAGVARVP